MPASYEGLIADHAAIDDRAHLLIEDLRFYSQSDAGKAADDLSQLAQMVRQHIEEEEAILATLEGRADIERGGASWAEVRSSFETLRSQWTEFLDHWSADTIAAHWAEFRLAARSVLGHLRKHVGRETELFYSAALHSGVIALRA